MKKAFLTISLFAIVRLSFSQTISPQIIASSGDHYVGTNAQLSWTIGEVMTETYSSGSNQLTQGFHQTYLTSTLVQNIDETLELNVFPNPAVQQLTIKLGETKNKYSLKMFNNNGELLLSKPAQGNTSETIDVSAFADGIYILNLTDTENKTLKSLKINKIN